MFKILKIWLVCFALADWALGECCFHHFWQNFWPRKLQDYLHLCQRGQKKPFRQNDFFKIHGKHQVFLKIFRRLPWTIAIKFKKMF